MQAKHIATPVEVCQDIGGFSIVDAIGNGVVRGIPSESQADEIATALNAHDDLVKALQQAKTWIEAEMLDKGWPAERVSNPPDGSHLYSINAALAKVSA